MTNSSLSLFLLLPTLFVIISKKMLPTPRSQKLMPMFSSKNYFLIILAFTFRSMTHFELTFVYGVRKGTNFILLFLVWAICSIILFLQATVLLSFFVHMFGIHENQ
jgi:hypothetical protein